MKENRFSFNATFKSNFLNFPVLFFFSILTSSCISIKEKSLFEGYRGNPKKLEFLFFPTQADSIETEPMPMMKAVYSFNEKGKVTFIQDFRQNGTPTNGGSAYFYNQKGLETKAEFYELDGSIRSTSFKYYNKKGRLIRSESHTKDKVYLSKIAYEPNPKITFNSDLEPNVILIGNSVYKLDKKGRPIVLTDYLKNGSQKLKIEKEYDKKGNEISSRWFNFQNELYEYYVSSYNQNADQTSIKKFSISNNDTLLISTTTLEYKYDSLGNEVEKRIKSNGNIILERVNIIYP